MNFGIVRRGTIQDKAIGLTKGEAMRLIFHRWLWVNPKAICCFSAISAAGCGEQGVFCTAFFLEFCT